MPFALTLERQEHEHYQYFMPWLAVTLHLYSEAKARNQNGKPGRLMKKSLGNLSFWLPTRSNIWVLTLRELSIVGLVPSLLSMEQEKSCFVVRAGKWTWYHQLKMHFSSMLNEQCTKLEYGPLAFKWNRWFHLQKISVGQRIHCHNCGCRFG